MENITDRTKACCYSTPLSELVSLEEETNILGSDGQTDNYGSGSIWGLGDDNEG